MDKKKVLLGVGVIALIGVGYLVYRRIRTTSQSAEKNSRRIRVIGKRNVIPTQVEEQNTSNTENEI
jgi:CHASE3 domain sensor protein